MPVEVDLVFQRHPGGRSGQQCRAAAADQGNHQIIGTKRGNGLFQPLSRGETIGIGHWMRRFEQFQPGKRAAIAVSGNDDALQRAVPQRLKGCCHLGGAFARADHYGAPFRPCGQMGSDTVQRIGRRNGGSKQ